MFIYSDIISAIIGLSLSVSPPAFTSGKYIEEIAEPSHEEIMNEILTSCPKNISVCYKNFPHDYKNEKDNHINSEHHE